ncbi:hypothetical protein FRB90_011477 [Tulasnella sp. 427]|nr:hypothetical protein FRB90_011477 [Tulasnella sp. 427]
MIFDPEYLTFYGVTPKASSESQVTLICHQGDTELLQSFTIRVQAELRLQPALLPVLVGSPRSQVSYDFAPFISTIFLDRSRLNTTEREMIGVEVGKDTTWVRWDSATKTLECTIPDFFLAIEHSTNLTTTLTFTLPPARSATAPLTITVEPYVFTNFEYPATSIFGNFQLSLGQYIREPVKLVGTVFQPSDAETWMHLDQNSFILSGAVPLSPTYSKVSLLLTVTSLRTTRNATAMLQFYLSEIRTTPVTPYVVTRTTIALIILAGALGLALCIMIIYFVILPYFQPRQLVAGSQTPGAPNEADKAGSDVAVVRESSSATADTLVQRSPLIAQDSPKEPKSPRNGWAGLSKVLGRPSNDLSLPHPPQSPHEPPQNETIRPQLNALGLVAHSEPASRTSATWGPPVPRPPPGLTPEQTAEWVDNYVCRWVEDYTGETPGNRKRHSKHSRGTTRTGQPLPNPSGTSRWDGLPNFSDQPHTVTSTLDTSHFRLSTDSAPRNAGPSSLLTSHPPRATIRRSASCTNSSAKTSIGPSDVSSIASWDSLDSWELERRLHYEEPHRRGDFDPARSVISAKAGLGIQARPSIGGRPSLEPAETQTHRTSEDVPNIVVTASTEGAAGSAGPLSRLAQEPREATSTSARSSSEASHSSPSSINDSVHHTDGEEEEIVFFPRPVGAETPGSGLARSPHLEELARFTRSSA